MRDVLPTLREWDDDGRQFALATVVRTKGSAPRETGSVMGVREDGAVCGSVSGGCIESATVQACLAALEDGVPRVLNFPKDAGGVYEVALMCGGHVDVWIDPTPVARDPQLWDDLCSCVSQDTACVLATRSVPFAQALRRPGDAAGCSPLDAAAVEAHRSRRSQLTDVAGEEWFLHVLAPRPRLVIVGAVHISRALVAFAKQVGFETIIVDPRSAYAQFDVQPDAVIEHWPQDALREIKLDQDTYTVALTHDPKIDDAAIELFLKSDVAYVGALGSKTTQEKRKAALRERGVTEEQLERIRGPVGLEIGAENPDEIALSVIAEVVKVRRARG
jgi:xanthine dehydrogenase accessory factor